MNYNTDGFNERVNYIWNSNDINNLNKKGPSNFDNSFAKMKIDENKPDINTVNTDKTISVERVKDNRDDFILRSNSMRNARLNQNNPVSNAMNKNRFKNF